MNRRTSLLLLRLSSIVSLPTMDFARPHVILESTASRSGICHQSLPANAVAPTDDDKNAPAVESTDAELDTMVRQAANQAAADHFLGPPPKGTTTTTAASERKVNAQEYKDCILPPQDAIKEGDLVVIVISFDNLSFVYAKPKAIFSNRHGHFHHNDFIGKPFGCKIRSRDNRGYGFCYLLKPTPELWTRSLNHRTQIVHELDQSQIVHQLWLRPNMTVVESGTGSAALSHALLRTIAPYGHLHTYEFHPQRAQTARQELEQHTSPSMVTVHHKDVCGKAAVAGDDVADAASSSSRGGFDLAEQSVDAVFLDLPEPWLAIPHAAYILKPNARIASYSPCVEQSQRAIQALRAAGFHSIQTMEYRLQEHYVDEVSYVSPPRPKRQRLVKTDPSTYIDKNVNEKEAKKEATNNAKHDDKGGKTGSSKPVTATSAEESDTSQHGSTNGDSSEKVTSKMLVARPFVMMRGHTAFLTFACK